MSATSASAIIGIVAQSTIKFQLLYTDLQGTQLAEMSTKNTNILQWPTTRYTYGLIDMEEMS